MVLKIGSLNHAKGFIINKLWHQHQIGEKHLPVRFLAYGYPSRHRHMISEALSELRHEGVVSVRKKKTGRGSEDHVSLEPSKLGQVRGLMNAFRETAGLPRIGRDFKTLLPP